MLEEITDEGYWNDTVIVESDDTTEVECNLYSPSATLDRRYVENNDSPIVCPWNGCASYFSLKVDEKVNKDAA